MSRDYFAVFGKLFRTPKFRRMDERTQLSLLYVWGLAGDTDPEATWADLDALGDHLAINGRDVADAKALLKEGWLDELASGEVVVHDWDQWQQAASADIRKRYETHRKAEWRNTRRKRSKDVWATFPADEAAESIDPLPVEDARTEAHDAEQRIGETDQRRRRPDQRYRRREDTSSPMSSPGIRRPLRERPAGGPDAAPGRRAHGPASSAR